MKCYKGDIISFGPFAWRVLDVAGGNALLIVEGIIGLADVIHYNLFKEYTKTYSFASTTYFSKILTWKDCLLRKYLNGEFLSNFSEEEKALLIDTHIDEVSLQSTDKIFLLSMAEAKRFFKDDADRIAVIKYSEEALSYFKKTYRAYSLADEEALKQQKIKFQETGSWQFAWCLRDTRVSEFFPSTYMDHATGGDNHYGCVRKDGTLCYEEAGDSSYYFEQCGLRPAIRIKCEDE